jgi:hypothetical protein
LFKVNLTILKIYITADHRKAGPDAGGSPGYGITLLAETTTGNLHSTTRLYSFYAIGCTLTTEKMGVGGSIPEDLGQLAANVLLEEILRVYSAVVIRLL